MNSYTYRIINDSLVCINDNTDKRVKENKALDLLNEVDNLSSNKVYIKGYQLIIKNKDFSITIKNYPEFLLSKYRKYINNTNNIVRRNSSKIQREKNKQKKLIQQKITKGVMVAAPLVMSSLLITSLYKNMTKDVSEVKTLDKETIESQLAYTQDENINEIFEQDEKIKENVTLDSSVTIGESNVIEHSESLDLPEANLQIFDNSQNKEIIDIQNKYRDLCEKAGKRWGISPNILLGLLTQESHGNEVNLTQIEFDAWADQKINIYNYEENKWMKVVLTNNPNNYKDFDIVINRNELNNPYTNIATAAMLLNYSTNTLKTDNIFAILEYYNKGHGNFNKNMTSLEENTNKTRADVLANPTDTDIIDYSYVCNVGDPNYVCNVIQYIPDAENGGIYFYRIDDGEIKLININVNRTLSEAYVKNTQR